MNLIDAQGHAVSGATADSLQAWEQAAHALRCMVDDPLADTERALALAPEMTMAHVLKAWLHLLGTEPDGIAVARAACEAASRLPADDRERRHVEAASAVAAGRWREGGRRLEDLSLRYPLDPLALQAGHQVDFFRADSRMLRDRIARALPAWDDSVPGWHAVLGMHAFGLEETGDYAQAVVRGRRAVEIEPRDSWAWHAVAHVHEMRNQPREGIAWLEPASATWATGSFLAPHNWWHLALFHLELGDEAEALRLYDEAIGGTGSTVVLDLVDASAMLWRLHLRGVDVGDRWQSLADRWQPMAGAGQYAFNDLHAMLAFVAADRVSAQQILRQAQARAMAQDVDNASFTKDVGDPAVRAVQAFGSGDHASAAALLRDIRHHAHRFGGSHAQRDLIDLTLLEAALRGHDAPLARGLAAERLALRPRSPAAQRLAQRADALSGDSARSGSRTQGGSADSEWPRSNPSTRRTVTSHTETVTMKPAIRFVRLASGVRLEYAEQGEPSGTPVVMLHGITDSWRSFETVMAHLPSSLRVFSISQRGHGESDRPQSYRTREFAADAAAFIETLGLQRAIVVGHSMGSANAMRLAIDRPDLVKGLVLAGAFATFRGNAGLVDFHRDVIVPLQDPIERAFIEDWQRSTLAHAVDPAFFDAIVEETLKVPAPVWHSAFGALLEDDFASELHRIAAPTRLLWGDADAFVPGVDQPRIRDAVPGSTLVIYQGAGHALHWEQPERFAGDVARFASAL